MTEDELHENAAIALWNAFAPAHHLSWEDDPHQAEYRLGVDSVLEAFNRGSDNQATGTTWERLLRENQELKRVLAHIRDAFKDVRDCNPMFTDLFADDARDAATDAAVDSALAFQDRPTAAQIVGDNELVELLTRVSGLLQLSALAAQALNLQNQASWPWISSHFAVKTWAERFGEDGSCSETMTKLQSILARLTEDIE